MLDATGVSLTNVRVDVPHAACLGSPLSRAHSLTWHSATPVPKTTSMMSWLPSPKATDGLPDPAQGFGRGLGAGALGSDADPAGSATPAPGTEALSTEVQGTDESAD